MNWRELALADIKLDEGCRYTAYQDQGGVWTCGHGHTGTDVVQETNCTPTQADQWLKQDFLDAEQDLNKHCAWWDSAPDAVKRGLVNMCFNLGWPRLAGFKKMLAAGESGDWNLMADESLHSKWAEQVGDRGLDIAELFRSAAQGVLV